MESFTISKDTEYLKQDVQAYYNADYTTMGKEGNPDYLNPLFNLLYNNLMTLMMGQLTS